MTDKEIDIEIQKIKEESWRKIVEIDERAKKLNRRGRDDGFEKARGDVARETHRKIRALLEQKKERLNTVISALKRP